MLEQRKTSDTQFDPVPSVTVLLAAYNGAQYIEEQIRSILAQEMCRVFLYVSLDVSTDDSNLVLQRLSAGNESISLLPSRKQVFGSADNFFYLLRSVDFSGSDFVALADQDDIWHANKLSSAIRCLQKDLNLGGYSADVEAFWPSGKSRLLKKSYPQTAYDYYYQSAGPGCTYVLPSKVASELGAFLVASSSKLDQIAYHDWLIYAFVRGKLKMNWHIDATPRMRYRQHAGNVIGINHGISAYLQRARDLFRGWYREQVQCVADLVGHQDAKVLTSRRFVFCNMTELRRNRWESFLIGLLVLFGVI